MIEIVNWALSKLGEGRITSLDDNSKAATLAKSLLDLTRDSLIAEYRWGFALRRRQLPALAEAPAFGWGYAYQLPEDCLRVLEAGGWPVPTIGGPTVTDTSAWAVEGRQLVTNMAPPMPLIYLARVTDPAQYPPEFRATLAAKLAAEMAEALTGATTKKDLAFREYDLTLTRAKRVGAIQRPPVAVADDSWALAREL